MLRRPTSLGAVVLALVLLLSGCGQAADLADDARAVVDDARTRVDGARTRLDDLASRADEVRDRFTWCGAAVRLGTAVAERDADAAQAAADDLRRAAPDELADEVGTIVEAIARSQAGDAGALTDGEVVPAAQTVLDTAIDSCGVGG